MKAIKITTFFCKTVTDGLTLKPHESEILTKFDNYDIMAANENKSNI